jgi:hypothetical protein
VRAQPRGSGVPLDHQQRAMPPKRDADVRRKPAAALRKPAVPVRRRPPVNGLPYKAHRLRGEAVERKPSAQVRRIGKAHPLRGECWDAWVQHVMSVGPTWLYAFVCISELFCLRATECLRLDSMDGLVYLFH